MSKPRDLPRPILTEHEYTLAILGALDEQTSLLNGIMKALERGATIAPPSKAPAKKKKAK